jgi:hypothetical protein
MDLDKVVIQIKKKHPIIKHPIRPVDNNISQGLYNGVPIVDDKKERLKRCPKKTRRMKNGECKSTGKKTESGSLKLVELNKKERLKRCPKKTRRMKNGECKSTEKKTENIIINVLNPNISGSPKLVVLNKKERLKRCPKKTRRMKNGECKSTEKKTEGFVPIDVDDGIGQVDVKNDISANDSSSSSDNSSSSSNDSSSSSNDSSSSSNIDGIEHIDVNNDVNNASNNNSNIDGIEQNDINNDVNNDVNNASNNNSNIDGIEQNDINNDVNNDSNNASNNNSSNNASNNNSNNNANIDVTVDTFDYLYPDLDDPEFNLKIASKKEFNDTQYDGNLMEIKKQSNFLCKAEFELMPHQLFVRNFLSIQTPYNSLLLYHGLGSGKTCSAIGVAEEMRSYIKQIGFSTIKRREQYILVIAAPNVLKNFQMQLFDPSKLKQESGVWNIKSCVGNSLLNEMNPTHVNGLTKSQIISNIQNIINSSYHFFGYIEFGIYASKCIKGATGNNNIDTQINNAKTFFNNRLIIIDEVHNLRSEEDNKKSKVASNLLYHIVEHADNTRLLLLSATPMYNSFKEIIWITNLLNLNDGRPKVSSRMIFDSDGNFLKPSNGEESGIELLKRKLSGYISYVRGENPYTFPFRIYPNTFDKTKTFLEIKRPTLQLNNNQIIENDKELKSVQPYLSTIIGYQKDFYLKTMNRIKMTELEDDKVEKYGYDTLQIPIQALNIVYPSIIVNVGESGLLEIMDSTKKGNEIFKLNYKDKSKRIFKESEISKYSSKISSICSVIRKSTGIILIYSQYLYSGLVPMALALEEMGFTNYHNSILDVQDPPIEQIDAIQYDIKSKIKKETKFHPAKYMMITGNKIFSPSNADDLAYFNDLKNNYGEKVKVILISRAGAEGLDFKNIRQIHVMDPWYNLSRVEQIIGRGVRNLSHCNLPFEERNVEIYLHASLTGDEKECADLYVYRMAERKAIQIGKISRLLKEISVDCLLNIKQSDFTIEKLNKIAENKNISITLSSNKQEIIYQIGDRPFTDICDYMGSCDMKCSSKQEITAIDMTSYSLDFITTNNLRIMDKIRQLFKEQHFYKRESLIHLINNMKPYPIQQIYNALSTMVNNKNLVLQDKYGRIGILENKNDIYLFQPLELKDDNASLYDRYVPIEYNPDQIIIQSKKTNLEIDNNFDTIVNGIDKIFNNIFNERKVSNHDKYYDRFKKVKNYVMKHLMNISKMKKYLIHHYLDTCILSDKLVIIKHIYSNSAVDEKYKDIEKEFKSYFDDRLIINNTCIAISNTIELFVYRINDWSIIKVDGKLLAKFKVLPKNMNESFIGFFSTYKEKSITPVFKIKNMNDENKDKAILIEKSGKSNILKVIDKMNNELSNLKKVEIYNYSNGITNNKILVSELCIILEMIMREIQSIYNAENNDKKVFLTPEEGQLIN